MEAKFNMDRKELVEAIGRITESKPKYLGPPTFAYEIAEFRVNRDGTVESQEEYDLRILTEALAFEGVLTKEAEMPEENHEELTIYLPQSLFSEKATENLISLVAAKQELFKRAFGGRIELIFTENSIGFPWFKETDAEYTNAYTIFIEQIRQMVTSQKRISAKPKEIQNEKYEFRCFLLRLGFIGDEYKGIRKILLKNLKGSSAFKGGVKA